jgi:YggT family protein
VGGFLCIFLRLYLFVLIIRIVMSWIPISPGSPMEPIYRFFFMLTEPVLRPFRGLLPPVQMGGMALDLSPILLFVGINVLLVFVC